MHILSKANSHNCPTHTFLSSDRFILIIILSNLSKIFSMSKYPALNVPIPIMLISSPISSLKTTPSSRRINCLSKFNLLHQF